MKTAKQWMDDNDPAWGDEYGRKPELTEHVILAIQRDALEHAASLFVQDGNPELFRNRIIKAAVTIKH
jgi:hypothetical protein